MGIGATKPIKYVLTEYGTKKRIVKNWELKQIAQLDKDADDIVNDSEEFKSELAETIRKQRELMNLKLKKLTNTAQAEITKKINDPNYDEDDDYSESSEDSVAFEDFEDSEASEEMMPWMIDSDYTPEVVDTITNEEYNLLDDLEKYNYTLDIHNTASRNLTYAELTNSYDLDSYFRTDFEAAHLSFADVTVEYLDTEILKNVYKRYLGNCDIDIFLTRYFIKENNGSFINRRVGGFIKKLYLEDVAELKRLNPDLA